jgi:heat-inducible transcriptional repressor
MSSKPRNPVELSERQRAILQAVVEDYIATAEPVGSRTLTKRNREIDLSPATVRNAMADLEDLGYLSATHASAGRVPTVEAFRVYVEQLAQRGRISPREKEIIEAVTSSQGLESRGISQILEETGRVLSMVANHATLLLMPSFDEVVFSDIEFIPVRERHVLAVFVARSGLVQHRVLEVEFPVDRNELRKMSNYLKGLLTGKALRDVRQAILDEMRQERAQADEMMRFALVLGEKTLSIETTPADAILVEGERSLLDQPEFADIGKMRELLRAFEEKTVLLRLLEAAARPMVSTAAKRLDTQVLLGADGQARELRDLAVVMATYQGESGSAGHVGVVGPVRMDYSRVIPLVELAASALSKKLGTPSDDAPEPTVPPDPLP